MCKGANCATYCLFDNYATALHNFTMWIDRDIFQLFRDVFEQFPSLVITGARQTGKTSGVRHTFPEAAYVSLDFLEDARQAAQDPVSFLGRFSEPLIIDEIQYVPELLRYLKGIIDRDRRPGRFVLTGSQPFHLMAGVSESMSGRAAIISMPTLATKEVIVARPSASFRDCLLLGGFPAIQADTTLNSRIWFSSYLTTYIERDVRNLLHVSSLTDFSRFMRALAARSAQLLNITELARDVGIAPNTAKSWLSMLEASGQVSRLEPYYRNVGKRLVKSPKIYFNDTGLLCHLLGIETHEQLMATPLIGAIWETFVFSEISKAFASAGTRPPVWFWRTHGGDEIDFLVERGGAFTLIEAKFSARPDGTSTSSFNSFRKQYGEKAVHQGFIASTSEAHYPLRDGVVVRPAWGWVADEL